MRRGLQIALVVGGGVLFSAQAQADDTTGSQSLLGGNQVVAPVSVPVTVSGNSVSVVGDSSSSGSDAGSSTGGGGGAASSTSGEDSAAGGNQASAPVSVPVTVSGNSVSVLGDSSSSGSESSSSSGGASGGSAAGETSGEDSVAGGNQVTAPVTAPVTAGGNAVSVIG
ncbi:chaplin family protein, partial [Knoellia flava]